MFSILASIFNLQLLYNRICICWIWFLWSCSCNYKGSVPSN